MGIQHLWKVRWLAWQARFGLKIFSVSSPIPLGLVWDFKKCIRQLKNSSSTAQQPCLGKNLSLTCQNSFWKKSSREHRFYQRAALQYFRCHESWHMIPISNLCLSQTRNTGMDLDIPSSLSKSSMLCIKMKSVQLELTLITGHTGSHWQQIKVTKEILLCSESSACLSTPKKQHCLFKISSFWIMAFSFNPVSCNPVG